MRFSPYELRDFDEVLSLLRSAFDDNRQSLNFEVLGRFSDTPQYKKFVVREEDTVVAYLAYCTRSIRYLDVNFSAASIGPVAVKPDAQSKGVGKHLMTSVLEHLSANNIEFVYIQGIPHYYQKFGFIKYIEKIKRVVPTADANKTAVDTFIDSDCTDHSVYKELFDNYAKTVNFAADRSNEEWRWLISHASKSYYFYEPKIIRDQNGIALGYFCEDPYIPDSPREVVFKNDRASITTALATLKKFHAGKGCSSFDLKIPDNSMVADIIDTEVCERIVHDNPHGGDLLLIFDEFGAAEKLAPAFQNLLPTVGCQFDAKVEFKTFKMRFGVDTHQPYVSLDNTPSSSRIEFVDFVSGRLRGEDYASIETTPPHQYEIIQEKLYSNLMKFVFQGDNM